MGISDIKLNVCESKEKKVETIVVCDDAFGEYSIIGRADYPLLISKIQKYAIVISAENGKEVCRYIAFYANNFETREAFVTLFAVKPIFQNKHIGTLLMDYACHFAMKQGMKSVTLEVRKNNPNALSFYSNYGFRIYTESVQNTFFMRKSLLE